MRIITGSARGVKLETLEGENTRPTLEKVKEAVFSMIQFELEDATFLDLFAGSGQMGLEALSRGARTAVFVENNPEAMAIVKKNAHKTRLYDRAKFSGGDYADYLKQAKGRYTFDIIYLDPPYKDGSLPDILKKIAEYGVVSPNGKVICESEDDVEYSAEGFECERHKKYGRAYITLLRKKQEDVL